MLAFRYVTSQVWAIREEYLKLILEITSGNHDISKVNALLEDGEELNKSSEETEVSKKVAVIPVIGPIVRYSSFFSDISGGTSIDRLSRDFKMAMEDDDVESIVFKIDSPGGEANGVNEFAEKIYKARGKKPITAYVSNMACSAAYWIASATDEIIADETATLGSIGCVAVYTDTKKRDETEGITKIQFVSSKSPNKRPDLDTEEGKKVIQEEVDDLGNLFISKVARNRSRGDEKLTSDDVVENFNRGGVLMGRKAVKAGLADKLGSFESVLKKLNGDYNSTSLLLDSKENSMELENQVENKIVGDEVPANVETTKNEEVLETVSKADFDSLQVSLEELKEENVTLKENNSILVEENEKLKASLEELGDASKQLEIEKVTKEAEAFAKDNSDKMTPAQAELFVANYVTAFKDDKSNPLEEGSRVEQLKAFWEDAPKHNLTSELMEDDLHVIENNGDPSGNDNQLQILKEQATEFAKKMNAANARKYGKKS